MSAIEQCRVVDVHVQDASM